MLISLAWKNVWRNKKRSLIILTAIAIGLGSGLFASAVIYGMWDATVNTSINRDLGHLQIHTPAFQEDALIGKFIPDWNEAITILKNEPAVIGVSGRTILEGMASSATSSAGIKIIAIEPTVEKTVSDLYTKMTAGQYFDSDKNNAIIIGKTLADKLDLHLNSKIVLSFQGLDESIMYNAFRIIGIFDTESSIFDGVNVFIRQTDLFNLLGSQPFVHEIAVRLNTIKSLGPAMVAFRNALPNLKVESWKELAPELSLMYDLLTLYLNIFLGIILFALLFGITNTMLMAVMDRIREFGVLLAVGLKRKKLIVLIMLETVVLSISGGAVGIFLGVILIRIFAATGINLAFLAKGLSSLGVSSMLYPALPFSIYMTLTGMIIVTAILSAIAPARKAIKLNPSSAIRTY